MVRFTIAAAALGCFGLCPAPAMAPVLPDADPAIWVVNDRDTVIFLFGTFHALDGKSEWFNDEVETAFVSADELVLETIVPTDVAATPKAAARGMAVAPSASFLASTRLAISAGRAKGMQVDKGADAVLRRAAEAAGKPVDGLESFDEQLAMFGRMPVAAGGASAGRDPVAARRMSAIMGWMQAAWNRGDEQVFAGVVHQLRSSSPEAYRLMFTERNAHWAGWIAERLDRPGTVFVAVGAGHLAGADSVQAKLAELGVRSERIN